MGRKTVALNLDEEIYREYQKYCEENNYILSRKVETHMKKELEENKKWDSLGQKQIYWKI